MNLSHQQAHQDEARPPRSPFDDMTLSELILYELGRQRLSYDAASERAHERGYGISGSYLCILVRHPLKGLRDNTLDGVAAALGVDANIVAGCAMRSWGKKVYPDVGGTHVVISRSIAGLTAAQAMAVRQIAYETEQRMEAITNDAGERAADKSARAPVFSNGISHQRGSTADNHGGSADPGNRSTTRHRTRADRPKANS